MAVIILLDRRYIVVKTVERLHRPIFVAQQAGCLPQSLVGLESGKDKDILLELLRYGLRNHAALQRGSDRPLIRPGIRVHQGTDLRLRQHLRRETLPAEYLSQGRFEDTLVDSGYVFVTLGLKRSKTVPVQFIDPCRQPRFSFGADPKKPSCPDDRLPVTSIPNLSLIQVGSIS